MFEEKSSALIEPEELLGKLSDRIPVKIIDASFFMPGQSNDQQGVYKSKRIGNAVFFDIDEIADRESSLPHMLPSQEAFSRAVSELGISNDDEVVIYGQSSIAMGPARAWWMFRVFGHDNVRVLNGTLISWEQEGFPVKTSAPSAPHQGAFNATYRPGLVAGLDTVRRASEEGGIAILDARSRDRFYGNVAEPRPGLSAGHIPGSKCLPCFELIEPDTGKMKSRNKLGHLFEACGLTKSDSVITTCGSGVTACLLALGLYEWGYADVAVYDGSWSEWGREQAGMKIATRM